MTINGFNVNGKIERYNFEELDNLPDLIKNPTGGSAGQVLKKTDSGVIWANESGGDGTGGGGGGTGGGGGGTYEPPYTGVTSNKLLELVCFFYGYPRGFQNLSNLDAIAQSFTHFDVLIWGDGVEDPARNSHGNAIEIWEKVKLLKPSCKLFGYIPIGMESTEAGHSLPYTEIARRMDNWKAFGATGIFLDEFGYDYYVTRERQNTCIQMARDRGMNVFANSWTQSYVFSNASMPISWLNNNFNGNPNRIPAIIGENDYTLFENMYLEYDTVTTNGVRSYIQQVARHQRMLDMIEFSQTPQSEFGGKSWYQHYKTKGVGLDSIVFEDAQLAREGYLLALASGIQGYAPSTASWGSSGGAFPLYPPPTIRAASIEERQPARVQSYNGIANSKITTVIGNSTIDIIWVTTNRFDYTLPAPANARFSLVLDRQYSNSGKSWKKPANAPIGFEYYATDLEETFVHAGEDVWRSAAASQSVIIEKRTSDPVTPSIGRIWLREDL